MRGIHEFLTLLSLYDFLSLPFPFPPVIIPKPFWLPFASTKQFSILLCKTRLLKDRHFYDTTDIYVCHEEGAVKQRIQLSGI